MEFLLCSTGRAVFSLVQFADSKVEDGTMKKKRFIVPPMRRLKKWVLGVLKVEDSTTEHTPDATESGAANIYSGASFHASKDPEHLPPTNALQRFGNGLRKFGSILGSTESAFGFRVACATLSLGIVAYLKDTSHFFLTQRLVWALIMISIGMTVTAGSGVFGFFGRIAGTCRSYLSWCQEKGLLNNSPRHVYKSCNLVHSRWAHRRCHRIPILVHLCRILLSPKVSALSGCGSSINGNTR